jgi:hypothetical protein
MATPGERVSVRTPGQRDGATVQIIDQRSSGRIDQQRGTGPDGEELVRLIVRDELVEGRRRNAF